MGLMVYVCVRGGGELNDDAQGGNGNNYNLEKLNWNLRNLTRIWRKYIRT
jgi:hypothetical protein